MRQGVLHEMSKKRRWIPVSARPLGDFQRCARENVPQEQLRHWHFQCPHWSSWDCGLCGRTGWGWPCWCSDSRSVAGNPVPSHAPGPTFRVAAACWAMAMAAVGSYRVAAVAVRGWAPKTQMRYRSVLSTLVGFEGARAPQSSLTDMLSGFVVSRVSMGQARSTIRGYASAMRARMSNCFRGVCGPSTGGLRSRVSPHPGSLTWDRAGSVSSGPERHRRKNKLWQPLLASVGCFSPESLKHCPSHRQAWRVIP